MVGHGRFCSKLDDAGSIAVISSTCSTPAWASSRFIAYVVASIPIVAGRNTISKTWNRKTVRWLLWWYTLYPFMILWLFHPQFDYSPPDFFWHQQETLVKAIVRYDFNDKCQLNSVQNPCWLMIIGDYTTQYIGGSMGILIIQERGTPMSQPGFKWNKRGILWPLLNWISLPLPLWVPSSHCYDIPQAVACLATSGWQLLEVQIGIGKRWGRWAILRFADDYLSFPLGKSPLGESVGDMFLFLGGFLSKSKYRRKKLQQPQWW